MDCFAEYFLCAQILKTQVDGASLCFVEQQIAQEDNLLKRQYEMYVNIENINGERR